MDTKNIKTIDVETAVDKFSSKSYGIHYLIIYPDLITLREFYSYYIQKNIEEKNEVIQIAPFYETENSVRETLSTGHRVIKDIVKLEKEKTLIIVDSFKKYLQQKDKDNVKADFDANRKLVKDAKSKRKNGVSVLGDIGSFPFTHRIHDLIEYESFLPKEYTNMDFKGFCLYHKDDFSRLTKEQRQKLIDNHGMTVEIKSY